MCIIQPSRGGVTLMHAVVVQHLGVCESYIGSNTTKQAQKGKERKSEGVDKLLAGDSYTV